jgi:alkylhydroperoxidase family enzyme
MLDAGGVFMSMTTTPGANMANTTRIPPTEVTGFYGWMVKRFSRKVLGQVPDAIGVLWHNKQVLKTMMGFGAKADKWEGLDPNLKSFSHMAVAAFVGCSWCLDYGYFQARNEGLDLAKASRVPRWRESRVFTSLERDVMEYAEAMSDTPLRVTDELSARLLEQLGPSTLVQLTAWVAFANMTTRSNVAMGIEAQGFSTACELPLAQPSVRYATPA